MTRRELRENIFKIVFRAEFHGKDEMTEQRREYMKDKVESDDISDKESELDVIITSYSPISV